MFDLRGKSRDRLADTLELFDDSLAELPLFLKILLSVQPRSGDIYVAQCVSTGIVDCIIKSRGAAASRKARLAPGWRFTLVAVVES
jgi:hypothetical protein